MTGLTILAAAAPFAVAAASEAEAEPDCFDAAVSASIVRQVPTLHPDCGKDCIIMSWPWFVELDVERVEEGEAPTGRLTVLTVQHTYYVRDLGVRHWWLRRNAHGGFNMLRLGARPRPSRCAKGTPPARPFIRPGPGRTLRELMREGEAVYGPGR